MPAVLLVLALLVGGFLLLRGFSGADPRALARLLRLLAVVAAVGVVLFLALTGRLGAVLGLAPLLLPVVLGWRARSRRARTMEGPAPGQVSSVDTAYLRVALDHDTGRMAGEVLQGRFAGKALDDLSTDDLVSLREECAAADPPSVALVEAYLDRTHGPDWRAAGAQAGPDDTGAGGPEPMTRDEAYLLLGLEPGATPEAVKAAHRRLMKRYHPDRGGSAEIAAKLNQARDLLLP